MRLNEDNRSGFHTHTVNTGIDRSVTGGNDAPVDVGLPRLKQSAKEAGNILMGKGNGGGSVSSTVDSHNVYNIDNSVHVDNSVHHSGVADGLAWFGTHFKEIAIVAAASAAILAIAKLIKGANKSIKFRYNKVVKTLQRAQKDFTVNPKGLDMRAVMPGIGSMLNDYLQNFFSGMWSRKKRVTNNNIGLHPFCANYIEEIERDYATATAAFSKIKLGSEKADQDRNTDSSVGGADASVGNVSTSAYSGKIYSSFKDAYSDELLNEGVSPNKLDESVLAAISAGVALTSLAVKAGTFLYQRYKNGKPVGEPKAVQVTAESTREICYAIINNYADKYVNMTQVFKELGIDSKSLADIDKSQVDKLRSILEKYQKPEKNAYTKQYERIEKAYKKMLKHYYNIGDGIIANFVKYSEGIDEKHSNLIVASKEKLQNMWDVQKDFYDNNFSHVIIEIVSSEAYIKYLDFIINKVLPVFKSGLAGDADYIFDVVPKKGEYYIIRQTGDQAMIQGYEDLKGKAGIAEVVGFDKETKKITFKFVGALKDGNEYNVSDDGIATLDNSDPTGIDYDVYKNKGDIELEYGKWLSVDPILLKWNPEKISTVYYSNKDIDGENCYQYVFCTTTYENADKGYDKVYVVTTKRSERDVVAKKEIAYKGTISPDDYDRMCNSDLGYWSTSVDEDVLNYWKSLFKEGEDKEEADTIDKVVEIIKGTPKEDEVEQNDDETEDEGGKEPEIHAVSKLYTRETKTDRGRDIIEYAYAVIEQSDESLSEEGKTALNELFGFGKKKKKNTDAEDDSAKDTEDNTDDSTDNNDDSNQNDDNNNDSDDTFTFIDLSGDDSDKNDHVPLVEPDTEPASKDLVRMVICGNIDKSSGKSIMDDIKESKFDGSSITIDPACSIDDVNKELERIGFTQVSEDANKIMGRLLQLVMSQTGKVRKSNVGSFAIDNIEKALKETENRENAAEKIEADAGKIADGILDKVKGVLTGSPKDMFARRKLTSPGNPTDSIKLQGKPWNIFLLKKEFSENPYIEYDVDVTDDNTGKQFTLYLYPTVITKAGTTTKEALSGKSGYGVIIYMNKDIIEIAPFEKSEIETAVRNMFKALVEGGTIEPSRFEPVETKPSEETSDQSDDNIETDGLDENKKRLAADITNLFDIVSVSQTESGAYKFHNNGKKNDDIEIMSPEGDTDLLSVNLKNFEKTTFTAEIKGDKINVKLAMQKDVSDEVELKSWTKKEVFSVVGKLMDSIIKPEDKSTEDETGSIDTSKLNDDQKKLAADIDSIFKMARIEKGDGGVFTLKTVKSQEDNVTKTGQGSSGAGYFSLGFALNDIKGKDGNAMQIGIEYNKNGLVVNVRYDGKTGDGVRIENWNKQDVFNAVNDMFGKNQGGDGQIDMSKLNAVSKQVAEDITNLISIVKVNKGEDGKLSFDVLNKNAGNVEIVTNVAKGVSMFNAHLKTASIKIAGDIQGDEVVLNIGYTDGAHLQPIKVNSWTPVAVFDAVKRRVEEYEKSKAGNEQGDTDNTQKESVSINYKTKTSVSESTGLNVVNVKRKVSGGKFRNWYVLSEAVYDDGSGYVSKLDNKRVVESMTDRSDFSRFAKTSKLAKFMPFESQQSYVLASDKGYVPSIATPLYESVVLVKFDKMDNVIDKVVIGRNKIV